MDKKKIFQNTFSLFKRDRNDVYKLYFLAFLSALFSLCVPLGVQFFVNFLVFRVISFAVLVLIAFIIISLFLEGWVNIISFQVIEKLRQKVFTRYSLQLIQHLSVLDVKNIQPEVLSEKINYFMETASLDKSISQLFKDVPKATIQIVLSILLLIVYHPIFIFFSFLSLFMLYWMVVWAAQQGVVANLDQSKTKYRIFGVFQELALEIRFLKEVYQRAKIEDLEEIGQTYLYKRTRYFLILRRQYWNLLITKIILISLMFIVGLILVQNDVLNVGQFLAAELILARMLYALEDIVISLDGFFNMLTAKHKLDEIISFPTLPEPSNFVNKEAEKTSFWSKIYYLHARLPVEKITYYLIFIVLASALLPWTQNIQSRGFVTTLMQNERPQPINSTISGKIKKWYVKEGAFVNQGDTLVFLEEIKVDYLDPLLLERMQTQIQAKETALQNYDSKLITLEDQKNAFERMLKAKLNQIENKKLQTQEKIKADSLEILAAKMDLEIAEKQLERQRQLYKEGLVSLTQLEAKTQGLQTYTAKLQQANAKLTYSTQELENIILELENTTQEYREKISKLEGEQFQIEAYQSSLNGEIAKLKNQFDNYQLRNQMYYILAPQAGQITKIEKSGVGQIIKEDEKLLEIVPQFDNLGLEIFIPARDIPLIAIHQKIMILFDGYPAIVFSGWPKASYGTFEGKVISIDNKANEKGLFRVLVAPYETKKKWPEELRLGIAVRSFILLKNVFLGYEIWRQVNGFPPDYYQEEPEDIKKEENVKK